MTNCTGTYWFLDCKETESGVVELRLVQASMSGNGRNGLACPVPCCPQCLRGPGLSFTAPHLQGRSFQEIDIRLLSPAGLDRPARWVASRHTFQSHPSGEAECCSSYPEKYVTSLGTALATLPGFGLTSAWGHREKEAERKRQAGGGEGRAGSSQVVSLRARLALLLVAVSW